MGASIGGDVCTMAAYHGLPSSHDGGPRAVDWPAILRWPAFFNRRALGCAVHRSTSSQSRAALARHGVCQERIHTARSALASGEALIATHLLGRYARGVQHGGED